MWFGLQWFLLSVGHIAHRLRKHSQTSPLHLTAKHNGGHTIYRKTKQNYYTAFCPRQYSKPRTCIMNIPRHTAHCIMNNRVNFCSGGYLPHVKWNIPEYISKYEVNIPQYISITLHLYFKRWIEYILAYFRYITLCLDSHKLLKSFPEITVNCW